MSTFFYDRVSRIESTLDETPPCGSGSVRRGGAFPPVLLRAVAVFLRFVGGDTGSDAVSPSLRFEEEAFAL